MGNFGQAIIVVFYAFSGFESVVIAAGDMDNPKKNVPIAILATILITSFIYILIQTVCIGTLGSELSGSISPVADSAKVFLGDFGKILVAVGTLISITGINIATAFNTPRSGEALAEGGVLPSFISKKNRYGQPYAAIIISVAVAIPLVLSGSFAQLVGVSVISKFGQYIPTCFSVIVFRRRNSKSSFRVPFGYFIPIVSVCLSLWLLYSAWADDMGKPIIQNRVIIGLVDL